MAAKLKPADRDASPPTDEAPPPRPANAAEIAAMLAEAEARAKREAKPKSTTKQAGGPTAPPAKAAVGVVEHALAGALWGGLAIAGGAVLVVLADGTAGGLGAAVAALAGAMLTFFVGVAALRISPAAIRAAVAGRQDGAERLAGAGVLTGLQIAERALDADPDARLISRRNGVVVFANAAYFALAREAGLMGPTGLPPRIDRLFAAQGPDSTKIFRLCRAAKSAADGEEIVTQHIGVLGGGRRRRFEVSVRPIEGDEEFVAWRLRDLPAEAERQDFLASSFADFPEPVFALEKSGQIAWTNAAMRTAFGAERGALRRLEDFLLGEAGAVVRELWRADSEKLPAKIRGADGTPREAAFAAFRRGGVGEGFVCVKMSVVEAAGDADDQAPVAGDLAEAPFGYALVDGEIGRDAKIVEMNRAFGDFFAGGRKEATLARVFSEETVDELAAEARRKPPAGAAPRAVDTSVGDGAAARTFALFVRPVRRRRGAYGARRTVLYAIEVTDRKRMEQDHAQDQKLKAIGFIAGEVAHDFNNLLQVIQGNCEHLMLRHPAGDPAYQDLVLIRENAQRAANLTKQLLAYSRKQTLTRRVQSITDVLVDFSRFLDRAVGEKVKFELVNGRGLPPVKVDRNQLETAIMNLAVNARDAMAPEGGRLTIATRLVSAAELEEAPVAGVGAQDHVLIEVADTGPGVPADIREKIFEPFFTTKEAGKGTGLGLSTVHGVIGQMGGAIVVADRPEGGAVFRIYLPAHQASADDDPEEARPAPPPAPADYSGTGRILVVEDEPPVRAFLVATLKRAGYEVADAADGSEALDLLGDDPAFDLIVSDVMMQEVDGPTMVLRARRELGVDAAVILISGYAEAAVREQMDAIENVAYIQKPFPMTELGARVKEALYARSQQKAR